ncbi:hypothetical protein [Streptomyces peucetius]|uniref:Uncharacterized protein n=1 Tax=Streptomyces peucetius TaxID=1950 RepID=A0ABY6IF53_STRPE|nr:hypothetical protein [Streptomyces peucetius]UYQ65637.1 hypothetical protein OGH68_32035 [Streptomyces peucetius]
MRNPHQPHRPVWSEGQWPYGPPPLPPAHLRKRPSRAKAWLTHGGTAFAALIAGALVAAVGICGSGEVEAGTDTGAAVPTPTATATGTAKAAPAPAVTRRSRPSLRRS